MRLYRDYFDQLLEGATEEVKKIVHQASKRIEEPHLKQPDYEREILLLLSNKPAPMTTRDIIAELEGRMKRRFSRADQETTGGGKPRWEMTARFGIYQGLKKRGAIVAKSKNQWIITDKGRAELTGIP